MIQREELEGLIRVSLSGVRRVVLSDPLDPAEAKKAMKRRSSVAWRAKNRAAHRAYQKAYYQANKAAIDVRIAKWKADNPKRVSIITKRARRKAARLRAAA